MIAPDLGLRLVYPEQGLALVNRAGRRCAYVNGSSLYFRAGDDEDTDTGSWRDPAAAHALHLNLVYFDLGTDAIQLGYSNDALTETVETIVTKGNSGQWKIASYDLAATARLAHEVYADFGYADLRVIANGEVYVAGLTVVETTLRADVLWSADQNRAMGGLMIGGYIEGYLIIEKGDLRWGDGGRIFVNASHQMTLDPLSTNPIILNSPTWIVGTAELQAGWVITPSDFTLAANTDDMDFGDVALARINPTFNGRHYTGFANGVDGRILILANKSTTNNFLLKHLDAGSAAGNRIRCSTGADITVAPNQTVKLWYDNDDTKWRDW